MMNFSEILHKFQTEEGLLKTLEIELVVGEDDLVTSSMTVSERHRGAPGVSHGGAIMALLDSALGFQALGLALQRGMSTSTVELKVNFLLPARIGCRLVVRPEVQSQGKSLLVLSGAAVDADTQERVAFAVGTFNLRRLSHLVERERDEGDEGDED